MLFRSYRWYVSNFGKSAAFDVSISSGIFTLNSNFSESDLHYDGLNTQNGSGDLVILVGLDSTDANTSPDKYLFVSGNDTVYGGARDQATNYNLDAVTKQIRFTKGTLSANVRKIWLYIGYKDTAINLRLNSIELL